MQEIASVLSFLVAGLFLVGTVMPWISTGTWWVRLFDFPRLQLVVLGLLALAGIWLLHYQQVVLCWSVTAVMVVALVFQAVRIAPFTPIWATEVQALAANRPAFTVFIANVLVHNDDKDALLALLRSRDPDMILLAEVDNAWKEKLSALTGWPHRIEHPLPDGYGMVAMSRFPLEDPEVRFLVGDDRPSTKAVVTLPSGERFVWLGLHPPPPGIATDEGRMSSLPRDAELLIVAREVRDMNLPVLICGDFNDVAWSHTTRLTKRIGGLLDPRIGRGLYNSYHAGWFFLRYPIDQILLTEHFALADLTVLPSFGSDHFAVEAKLGFAVDPAEAPRPQGDDRRDAADKIEKGREME